MVTVYARVADGRTGTGATDEEALVHVVLVVKAPLEPEVDVPQIAPVDQKVPACGE